MRNECLRLLGVFLEEDKNCVGDKTKSSCERKFKDGDFVTGVNPNKLSIYKRHLQVIEYDENLKVYILANAMGYKEEDLRLSTDSDDL